MSRKPALAVLLVLLALACTFVGWRLFRLQKERALSPDGEAFRRVFDRLDRNRDGRISAEERAYFGGEAREFRDFDADEDGCLDFTEFREMVLSVEPRRGHER